MSSASSSPPVARRRQAVAQLRAMFPDTDPGYLDAAVLAYPDSFTTDKLIARVASKMLDMNHGHWPAVLLRELKLGGSGSGSGSGAVTWSPSSSSASPSSRKGKQRAGSSDAAFSTTGSSSGSRSLLDVDEIATMNAALIQLNDMFPAVDLGHLRRALTSSRHSYIYSALANLLDDPTLSPDAVSPWHHANSSYYGGTTTAGSAGPGSMATHTTAMASGSRERRQSNDSGFNTMPGAQPRAARVPSSASRRRHEPLPKRQNPGEMTSADFIKDRAYINSAFQMIHAQFPNVWKSSIKAVMAEHNNDYFTSVEGVKRLQDERPPNFFARTWTFITQAFGGGRSSPASAPSSTPGAGTTKLGIGDSFSIRDYLAEGRVAAEMSPTLLYELHLHITASSSAQSGPKSTRRDSNSKTLGKTKSSDDTDAQDVECGCCFADVCIGEAASCADGCLFCKECVHRIVQESVFGQAPLRLRRDGEEDQHLADDGIGGEGTGIRCLSIEGCQATFSDAELRRCLNEETYSKLERALAQENLRLYQLHHRKGPGDVRPVRSVQCPFCSYVEVEEIPAISSLWNRNDLSLGILTFMYRIVSVVSVSALYLVWLASGIMVPEILNLQSTRYTSPTERRSPSSGAPGMPLYLALDPLSGTRDITKRITRILDDTMMRQSGAIFVCRNKAQQEAQPRMTTFASPALIYSMLPPPPASGSLVSEKLGLHDQESRRCGRPSCRLCGKLHYAGHECVDSLEGLRLAVETAASNAVKRQCPDCGLSFLKDSGCNKVVCRCGYVMCFVCRKGIADERYAHFCQHPRDPPGSACAVCTRCDLFKLEDEARAVKKAVEQAKADWYRGHPDFSISQSGSQNTDFAQTVLDKLEKITRATLTFLI